MSDIEISSDGDGEPTVESLAARVRDLETEVYGHANDASAGREVTVDVKRAIVFVENRLEGREDHHGAPIQTVYEVTAAIGIEQPLAKQAYEKLRRQGEVYEPAEGEVRSV
jgi:DNA replicative helicase MCM subunit Mcm2 (Cdc46/Mcm family)